MSCAHQLLTQEFPSQIQGGTKATASQSPKRFSCLTLLLCHLIPIIRIFTLALAPLSLTVSGDLCPNLGFPEQGSYSLNRKSSSDTTEMRKVLEHSTSGKRQRERPLFSLETRREGRTLWDVFNFVGVGEQKGKNQTLLRGVEWQYQRHPPETKGAPFSPRRILDPGRESQRSHGISTLVDLPSYIGQGLWQPGTPLSSMAGDGASGGLQTSIGPLWTKLFYSTISQLPEHCFSSTYFPEISSATCWCSRTKRGSTRCAGWIYSLENK